MDRKKIVILGDGYVGKTSILHAIKEMEFTEHIPNVYDEFEVQERFQDKQVRLKFIDTAGQEEFACLRKLSYKDADLFLLCFAVDDPVSFENLETKWIEDLEQYKKIPTILVGTKSDLQTNTLKSELTRERIIRFQKKIGAMCYIECSALTRKGIKELKDNTVSALFNNKQKSCVLQ